MGNVYIELLCPRCQHLTLHRRFRRFGKVSKDGRKALRRTVTYCLPCGKRVIDNARKKSSRVTIIR